MSSISHESDERLELYALGRLAEPQVALVEEHLLVCPACQARLETLETFALSMQAAISSEPAPVSKAEGSWTAWLHLKQPALAWAFGFAVLLLGVGFFIHSGESPLAAFATLQLTAVRGDIPSVAPAREMVITLADLPPEPGLRAEVVDSTGGPIWSGTADSVKLRNPLSAGNYFVRLDDSSGKLLHEYGFTVRPPR